MVSFQSIVTKVAIVVFSLANVNGQKMDVTYMRPTGDQVSGRENANTPNVRSPCPALNTLANHGILPRNGKDISKSQYKAAIMLVFELTDGAAESLVRDLPDRASLNQLSKHNFIEHDASLAMADSNFGADQSQVSMDLVNDVIGRAKNGIISFDAVMDAFKARVDACNKKWFPKCDLGKKQKDIILSEISTLMNILGRNEQISVEHFRSFFVDNRVPADWVPPSSKVDENRLKATQDKARFRLGFF